MIRIYTLADPRNGNVFYVGASRATDKQITSRHLTEGASKIGIRKELRQLKISALVETIDTASDVSEARGLEEYWLWQFRSWGFKLDNSRFCSGFPISKGRYLKTDTKPLFGINR
jgi:hypothetical protein